MKILIVYATKYGCTQKCVSYLAEKLVNAQLVNLKKDKAPNLTEYELVLIGSSVYIGQINKAVKAFCKANLNELLKKQIGLFVCSGFTGDTQPYFSSFPAELQEKAFIKSCFGGELNIDQLKGFDKFVAKAVTKATADKGQAPPAVIYENIDLMAEATNKIAEGK